MMEPQIRSCTIQLQIRSLLKHPMAHLEQCSDLIQLNMVIPLTWTTLMLSEPTKFCRVCGLEQLYAQYGDDGTSPSFEICSCCGVEFGYEDITFWGAQKYREAWLTKGKIWFISAEKPENWSWEVQKKQIPSSFRDIVDSNKE